MESRPRRPDRDPKGVGNLRQRKSLVVVQDDDRTLLDRQAAESTLQLIAIRERAGCVGNRWLDRRNNDACDECPLSAALVIARPNDQPIEPCVKAPRITQRRQVSPGDQERGLHRVFRLVTIVDDAHGDGVQTIDRRRCQRPERVAVTMHCAVDEIQHWCSPSIRSLHGMAGALPQTFEDEMVDARSPAGIEAEGDPKDG